MVRLIHPSGAYRMQPPKRIARDPPDVTHAGVYNGARAVVKEGAGAQDAPLGRSRVPPRKSREWLGIGRNGCQGKRARRRRRIVRKAPARARGPTGPCAGKRVEQAALCTSVASGRGAAASRSAGRCAIESPVWQTPRVLSKLAICPAPILASNSPTRCRTSSLLPRTPHREPAPGRPTPSCNRLPVGNYRFLR
jgi:hypothetical protein